MEFSRVSLKHLNCNSLTHGSKFILPPWRDHYKNLRYPYISVSRDHWKMLKQVQNTNKRINCIPYIWVVHQGFFFRLYNTALLYINYVYSIHKYVFFFQWTTVSPLLLLLQFFLLHVVTHGRTDKILISLKPVSAFHKCFPYPFYCMHVPEAAANVFPSLLWFLLVAILFVTWPVCCLLHLLEFFIHLRESEEEMVAF